MKLLDPYIAFWDPQAAAPSNEAAPGQAGSNITSAPAGSEASESSPTGQLKRGMLMTDVIGLLGQGRQLSESVSTDGLKTQVYEYLLGDRRVEVTYVDGLVVRFSISSR
jgi:hypothetical protein